jgi:putative acetyltransferase
VCNAERLGKYLLATVMRLIGIAADSSAARKLIALADEYLSALYPAECNYLESLEALSRPHVRFLGIEIAGELVACGAAKLMNDGATYGEIKRLFVLRDHRGKGHARTLMLALESWLRQQDIGLVRLEVGVSQPEALRLYGSLGYRTRGPFGSYADNPFSIFMEKPLTS